jgi:hypothetical protein
MRKNAVAQSAEFILEPDQKQILVLEPWGPSFEGVVQAFSSREGVQVVECSTITELVSVAKQISHCVVLAYCAGSSESERYRDLLKALQAEILAKKIRVLIAIGDNRDLKTVFLQDGASEVFEEPIGEKNLATKVDHALTLLTTRKQAAKKVAAQPNSSIVWVSPLGLESDCWLSLKEEIKSIAGKWIITMLGPSPRYGQWCALAPEKWEWVPSLIIDDPFIREEGAWIFRGECPEYRGGSWIFIGATPELAFIYKDECYGTKFSLDSKTLIIAEDSPRARTIAEMAEKERLAQKPSAQADAKPEQSVVEIQKPYFLVAALEIQSDCFAREERIPRFIDGSWVMKLSGPTPVHGAWKKTTVENGEEPIWQWTPTNRDSFILEAGGWIFQGAEPLYRDGLWTFIGKKPRLEFISGTEKGAARVLARKISIDSREAFLLAEDSAASLNALERLLSFRKKPAGYLKRAKYGTKPPQLSRGLFFDAPVHPMAAAFYVSEAVRKMESTPESVMKSFCQMLSAACGGGTIEPWIKNEKGWKCLNHEDLMDMSMLQQIEAVQAVLNTPGSGIQTQIAEISASRAVVVMLENEKIGVILFTGDKCKAFKEAELRAYGRVCNGVWMTFHARNLKNKNEQILLAG